MDTFVKHPAMVCVHKSYLRGNMFASSFPRNAYMSQYIKSYYEFPLLLIIIMLLHEVHKGNAHWEGRIYTPVRQPSCFSSEIRERCRWNMVSMVYTKISNKM
jgi:hypothetical protein